MAIHQEANSTIQAAVREYLESTNKVIYSDGSNTDSACGYDVVDIQGTTITKRIQNILSIYTAEIRAIINALQISIYSADPSPVTVYIPSAPKWPRKMGPTTKPESLS
jgi:hypothetical protein